MNVQRHYLHKLSGISRGCAIFVITHQWDRLSVPAVCRTLGQSRKRKHTSGLQLSRSQLPTTNQVLQCGVTDLNAVFVFGGFDRRELKVVVSFLFRDRPKVYIHAAVAAWRISLWTHPCAHTHKHCHISKVLVLIIVLIARLVSFIIIELFHGPDRL